MSPATPDRSVPAAAGLSVVVPAHNEARRIAPLLEALRGPAARVGGIAEIIIVDDGSTDDTAALCRAANVPGLRVQSLPGNQGKGAAIRAGLAAATGAIVAYVDADNSAPLGDLPAMRARLDAGADLVAGVRSGPGAPRSRRAPGRRLFSLGLRTLARLALKIECPDPQCGFKVMRRAVARDYAAVQRIGGFAFDLELLHLAHRRGWRVANHPIRWIDAPGSHVSPLRDIPRFLRDILRIRRFARQGAYRPARPG